MKWVLTQNHLTGDTNWYHGTCKPAEIANPMAFRLLDDDGEVYFTGILERHAFESASEDLAFEPLDAFGAAYGCTELQYKDNGHWKTL
jgi:hypothetical protein